MHAKELGGGSYFDLPEGVLEVLPSDPFEQLDVARKITSIALSTRVSALESESADLRAKITERDQLIAELQSQIDILDSSLADSSDKLAQAEEEKEALLKENASLSNSVKKLNRDVSKLEVFRKTLMQSLREEDDHSTGASEVVAKIQNQASFSSVSSSAGDGTLANAFKFSEDEVTLPPSRYSSVQSQISEVGNSLGDDREIDGGYSGSRPRISHGLLFASQTTTPRLTPPGSPPLISASGSPTKTSKSVSPRRHSMSFATTRGIFDSSQNASFSSADAGAQTGRTRVDGKEFFRQVRSRLSYEQFSAFLANVKELNAHKQTKEETLRKADEIFGADNKDLYSVFEGLITRNVH